MHAELRTAKGEVVRRLHDPAGGTFDAAGDFDDVLGTSPKYWLLKYVQPNGPRCDAVFNRHHMADLVQDIEIAVTRADSPVTLRGLDRLREMAIRCRDSDEYDDLYVWLVDPRPSLRDVVTDELVLRAPLPASRDDRTRIIPPPPASDTP